MAKWHVEASTSLARVDASAIKTEPGGLMIVSSDFEIRYTSRFLDPGVPGLLATSGDAGAPRAVLQSKGFMML